MIKPFTLRGVTFTCQTDTDGCYVWVSTCGRYRAKRTGRRFEATAHGERVETEPHDLKDAMALAVGGMN